MLPLNRRIASVATRSAAAIPHDHEISIRIERDGGYLLLVKRSVMDRELASYRSTSGR